jgi:hypothetical protein
MVRSATYRDANLAQQMLHAHKVNSAYRGNVPMLDVARLQIAARVKFAKITSVCLVKTMQSVKAERSAKTMHVCPVVAKMKIVVQVKSAIYKL